jgi:hypothetical protein
MSTPFKALRDSVASMTNDWIVKGAEVLIYRAHDGAPDEDPEIQVATVTEVDSETFQTTHPKYGYGKITFDRDTLQGHSVTHGSFAACASTPEALSTLQEQAMYAKLRQVLRMAVEDWDTPANWDDPRKLRQVIDLFTFYRDRGTHRLPRSPGA